MYSTNTRATESKGAEHRRRGADKRTLQQQCGVVSQKREEEVTSCPERTPTWPLTPGAEFTPRPLLLLHYASKLHLRDAATGCQSNSCVYAAEEGGVLAGGAYIQSQSVDAGGAERHK